MQGERGWIERNGTGEPAEWSGAGSGVTTSPRKEYVRPGGVESWRRARTDDETPANDWRSSGFSSRDKWSGRSWRDEEGQTAAGGGGGKDGEHPSHISRSYSTPANGVERGKYTAGASGKKKSWGDHDDSLPEWATEDPSDYGGSFDATGAFHDSEDDDPRRRRFKPQRRSSSSLSDKAADDKMEDNKRDSKESSDEGSSCSSSSVSVDKKPLNEPPEESQQEVAPMPQFADAESIEEHQSRHHLLSESSVDRMQEVADDMVAQLIMEDEIGVLDAHHHAAHHHHQMGKASPMLSNLAVAGANALAARQQQQQQLHNQQPPRPVSEYWFYQDPKQKVQGPFSAQEMAEWYIAGYFDETLLVRRTCDSRFSSLGNLNKICGGAMPFMASHLIPPMVSPAVVDLPPPPQQQLQQPQPIAASAAAQHPLLSVLAAAAGNTPPQAQIIDNDLHLR